MTKMMSYVEVCITNEENTDKVLGIKSFDADVESRKLNKSGYKMVSKEMCTECGCKKVAITLRESYSAIKNGWSVMHYDSKGGEVFYSRLYDIRIVDRM